MLVTWHGMIHDHVARDHVGCLLTSHIKFIALDFDLVQFSFSLSLFLSPSLSPLSLIPLPIIDATTSIKSCVVNVYYQDGVNDVTFTSFSCTLNVLVKDVIRRAIKAFGQVCLLTGVKNKDIKIYQCLCMYVCMHV